MDAKVRDPAGFRREVTRIGATGLSFERVTRDLIRLSQDQRLEVVLTVDLPLGSRCCELQPLAPMW